MIYFGINEALKRWKRIIVTSVLFALIIVLTFVCVSTYEAQSTKYDGFKEILDKKGFFAFINPINLMGDGQNEELEQRIKKELVGVDKLYYPIKKSVQVEGKEEWGYINAYGYDEYYASYHPALEAGCWFTDAPKENGVVNVVLTKGENGFKVGDKITILDDNLNYLEAKVCGILANKAAFYEPGRTDVNNDIYSLYSTYDIYNKDNEYDENLMTNPHFMRLIFMSKKDLSTFGGICLGTMFITFNDNISGSALEKNQQKLSSLAEFIVPNGTMKFNSDAVLMNKILVLLPLTACGFVMILLSFMVTAVLEAYEDRRKYTIFFLSGARIENSVLIRLTETLMTILISISLVMASKKILELSRFKNIILFDISKASLFYVILEIVAVFGLSVLVPLFVIRKKNLIHTLRSSKL